MTTKKVWHAQLSAFTLCALLGWACNAAQVEDGEAPPGADVPADAGGSSLDMPGVEPSGSEDPEVKSESAELTSFPPYYHPSSQEHIEKIEEGLHDLDVVPSGEGSEEQAAPADEEPDSGSTGVS